METKTDFGVTQSGQDRPRVTINPALRPQPNAPFIQQKLAKVEAIIKEAIAKHPGTLRTIINHQVVQAQALANHQSDVRYERFKETASMAAGMISPSSLMLEGPLLDSPLINRCEMDWKMGKLLPLELFPVPPARAGALASQWLHMPNRVHFHPTTTEGWVYMDASLLMTKPTDVAGFKRVMELMSKRTH